ncbi:MAG: lysophospholipid acyltransferase family protein [Gemmatimonadota bacterium]
MTDALDVRTRLAIRLGSGVLRALGATWRVSMHGAEAYAARHARGERVVLVMWHGQMLMCAHAHQSPTAVMISEHRDGEIIARVLGLLGHSAVRGSSSRGGARALLEAARTLTAGTDIAITPDGPRGPRHSFAPGALMLAFRASAPVVAMAAHVDRAWRLRSWDGFEIPKPFARITVVYSEPRMVDGADVRDASACTDEFTALLMDTLARARAAGTGASEHAASGAAAHGGARGGAR